METTEKDTISDAVLLKDFFEKSPEFRGKIILDEPLAQRTTFKIGGSAPVFFEPESEESLLFLIKELSARKIPYFILGGGSNIVISDKGFEGAVISTGSLNTIKAVPVLPEGSTRVSCGGGTPVNSLINFCKRNCISGAEEFSGLPGSAGGAVFMNARCFDKSISDILESVTYIDTGSLKICSYEYNSEDWAYKVSPFQNGTKIILEVSFLLIQKSGGEEMQISDLCRKYLNERISKGHFKFPSAGSVFRNNRNFGAPSGRIIDECGLRGKSIGGAQIAPWHGNFIINTGGATQKDVKNLVDFVVNEVNNRKGITLQTEIIFCGIQDR